MGLCGGGQHGVVPLPVPVVPPQRHRGQLPVGHLDAKRVAARVRREGRQFQPITPAGSSFGVYAALTVLALVGTVLMAVEVAGLYQLQPLEREDIWLGLGFYAAVAVVCARFAFRAQRKGHARQVGLGQGRPEPDETGGGVRTSSAMLQRPRFWVQRCSDLSFRCTRPDRSCPPGSPLDQCGTDPTRTSDGIL